MSGLGFPSPQSALDALLDTIAPVGSEQIALASAPGRVLAEGIRADRDSPPCDVSAMDGFAIRAAECVGSTVPIAGALRIGQAPAPLPPGTAFRIVTGAAIPPGADAVVKHEDVEVVGKTLRCRVVVRVGDHLRRRGENLQQGAEAVQAGMSLTAPAIAALASFGAAAPFVHRRVRIGIVTGGDELVPADALPDAWHLRDSNGPALSAMLGAFPSAVLLPRRHALDDESQLRDALSLALRESDVLIVTGGVSMGERDFVPNALRAIGVRVIFHRLPQRPGKPLLAGVASDGQPVLALPGNPLSALVTARRFAVPAIRRRSGITSPESLPCVVLDEPDYAALPLWWHRPVRLVGQGRAQLVKGRGSGDVVNAAQSHGFIEVPPRGSGSGPWPFLSWGQ